VEQSVGAREDFHEGAEIHNTRNFPFKYFTGFNFSSELFDPFNGFCGTIRIISGDHYHPVVLDINFNTMFINDAIDYFSTRSDDITNLVRINSE